jgi:hypothetical protein
MFYYLSLRIESIVFLSILSLFSSFTSFIPI